MFQLAHFMCTSVQKHTAYQSWWLSFGEHISNLACISSHIFISIHITCYRLTLSIIIFIMLKLLDERKYISYMTFVFISCVFLAVAPSFVCVCVLYLVFSVWHYIFMVDRLRDFIKECQQCEWWTTRPLLCYAMLCNFEAWPWISDEHSPHRFPCNNDRKCTKTDWLPRNCASYGHERESKMNGIITEKEAPRKVKRKTI